MTWLKLLCLMCFALTSWGKNTEDASFLTGTLDRSGRVLVATVNATTDTQSGTVAITRFDNHGKIDITFGDNGHILIRWFDDPRYDSSSSGVHGADLRVGSDGPIALGIPYFPRNAPHLAPAQKLSIYRFKDQGTRSPKLRASSLRLPYIRGGSLAVSEDTRESNFDLPVWRAVNTAETPRKSKSSEVKEQALLLRFIQLNDGSVLPEEVYFNVLHQVGEIQDLNLHELGGKVVLVAMGANDVFYRGKGYPSLSAEEWTTNREQVSVASTFRVTLGPADVSSALRSTRWGTLFLIGKTSVAPLSATDIEMDFVSRGGSVSLRSYASFLFSDEQKMRGNELVVREPSKDLKILEQVVLPGIFTSIGGLKFADLISGSGDS